MPRDGSGVYTRPPGTDAVPDTTIESSKYNNFVGDVETDLNAIRPIIAGGTAGSNPLMARAALQVERAIQPVTNFDSHSWETGSFYAGAGATSAPSGASHIGTVQVLDANNIIVQATDFNTGITYVRRKLGGTWVNSGAWVADASDKVAKAGDVMSGSLKLSLADPSLALNSTDITKQGFIYFTRDDKLRWLVGMQTTADETSPPGLVGSDFVIGRGKNDGTYVDAPVTISRSSGYIGVGTAVPSAPLHVYNAASNQIKVDAAAAGAAQIVFAEAGVTKGVVDYIGSAFAGGVNPSTMRIGSVGPTPLTLITAGAPQLTVDGAGTVLLNKGQLFVNNYAGNANQGVIRFNSAGDKYLYFDGTNFSLSGPLVVTGQITANGVGSHLVVGGNLQVNGSATFLGVFSTNNNIVVGGGASITGPYIIGTAGVYGTGGSVVSRASAGGSAVFQCEDETATRHGLFFWDRGTDTMRMYHESGNAIVLPSDGKVTLAQGFLGRSGVGGATSGFVNNLQWVPPSTLQYWVDATALNLSYTSDYRTKKDIAELPSTWDAVKALRPIKYTHTDFTPPSNEALYAKQAAEAKAAGTAAPAHRGQMFVADNVERWGFLAHELQETLLPSASSGVKDDPVEIQCPNPLVVIAALTKALQEAMARIEALEARR